MRRAGGGAIAPRYGRLLPWRIHRVRLGGCSSALVCTPPHRDGVAVAAGAALCVDAAADGFEPLPLAHGLGGAVGAVVGFVVRSATARKNVSGDEPFCGGEC